MANEITPTSAADLFASEVVANEFLLYLADRDASLLGHPALFYATGRGRSNVVKVPIVGLGGYDLLGSFTPGSDLANTALTDTHIDVTVETRAKKYTADDFAKWLSQGIIGEQMFAQDLVISKAQTLISLIANVTDDFTATAGASGVDATWANVLGAKAQLGIAKVDGPLLGVVHGRQWADLEINALSLGVLPAETMGGVITQGMQSYKGRWMGIDFFVSSHCPTANAGADRAGGIFGRGALAWADVQLEPEADPNIRDFGRARLERVRKGEQLATAYMFSDISGVAQAIDAAGVSLITDA